MIPSAPIVECRHVVRSFGTGRNAVCAVRDATFTLAAGSRVALVGRSGSGKSTVLHLMAGLDQPSSGTVTWPALEGARLRPGPVAMVFQAPSLLPPLDVRENVALPLLLLGTGTDDAMDAADAALDRLSLRELATKLPEEISGGQAQRVAVARALVSAPDLILADEPTGQLDSSAAREVVDALLATSLTGGAALVIATHDPDVAARVDTQWRMVDGSLSIATRDAHP